MLNRLTLADLPDGRAADDFAHVADRRNLSLHHYAAPRTPAGNDIYTLNDLKSLQDWTLYAAVPPHSADRRYGQLRRHGQALRDSARSRAAPQIRHHAQPARRRDSRQQRQRRRRLSVSAAKRAGRPRAGADRRRRRSDAASRCRWTTRFRPATTCGPRSSGG